MKVHRIGGAAAFALALLGHFTAHAQTVTVVTSFPKELTAAYKAAFEKSNPGSKVEILNKGTSAGVAYTREASAGSRPDVFWASAPDAFEVLAKEGCSRSTTRASREFRRRSATIRSTTRRASIAARRWPATESCGTRAT